MIKIDDRLMAICTMVGRCSVLLDIGSDHAYVPVWLFQNGRIERAVISDVNEGPVQAARRNIENFGFYDRCEFIVSDGFENTDVKDVDTACICGMGGELISDIIENNLDRAKSVSTLILQPMNSVSTVRKCLYRNGFSITGEDLVRDGSRFYTVIRAVPEREDREFDEIFFEIGYFLFEHGHENYAEYLDYIIAKHETIIRNCRGRQTENARKALEDSLGYIELITEVKETYEGKRFNQVH